MVAEGGTVRVFFDYGWEWPLWDEEGALHPAELELSEASESLMERWHAHWSQHFSPAGWDTPDAHVEHLQQGIEVMERLRAEVPDVTFQPGFHR